MSEEPKYVKITQIELDKIGYVIEHEINKNLKTNPMFHISQTPEYIRIKLADFLLGKEQHYEFQYQTPTTWKDHFKMTHRNNKIVKWWIKKYPIKFGLHRIDMRKKTIFPDFKIPEKFKSVRKIIFYESEPINYDFK